MDKTSKSKKGEQIKVGFKIGRELWKDVRKRAIDEEIEYQELLVKAVEVYLKGGGK